tara:strand:+ start:322 stop:465 length:144 start_codon:yes stop_codon:yes gene_type:complete
MDIHIALKSIGADINFNRKLCIMGSFLLIKNNRRGIIIKPWPTKRAM